MVRKAKIGQDIILTCMVDSLSNMTTILWTRNDRPILNNKRYNVVETINGREYKTNLVIRNIQSEDFGSYGCFAANEVGKDFAPISIVSLSNLNTTTVTGIIIGILLVIILGVLAFVFRKYCCSPYEAANQTEQTKY